MTDFYCQHKRCCVCVCVSAVHVDRTVNVRSRLQLIPFIKTTTEKYQLRANGGCRIIEPS